jgi:hypothetical protein
MPVVDPLQPFPWVPATAADARKQKLPLSPWDWLKLGGGGSGRRFRTQVSEEAMSPLFKSRGFGIPFSKSLLAWIQVAEEPPQRCHSQGSIVVETMRQTLAEQA